MLRGLMVGILLGVVLVMVGVYLYFSTGSAPVAVTAAPIPFERTFAKLGLNAYLKKLPHPEPQVPENEASYMPGAQVYKENCAVCHGLPDQPKTNIAEGMAPDPPQLFKGKGVTDDEAWESYWKVENGIRMTGMPGFKGKLTEPQIWQVSVLVKNADKMSPAVKAALLSSEPSATPVIPAKPTVVPPTR